MSRLLGIGAIALVSTMGGAGATLAATEVPVFDGLATITAVNQVCANEGWVVGTQYGLIFRSAARPSNKRGGGIQLTGIKSGYTLMMPDSKPLPGGAVKGTFSVTGTSTQVGTYTFTTPFSLEITPAKVVAGTPVVTIKGTLGNFEGVTGCTLTIFGVATPRL